MATCRFRLPRPDDKKAAKGRKKGANFSGNDITMRASRMERVKGIEPSSVAWEATALPLSYTRVETLLYSKPKISIQSQPILEGDDLFGKRHIA
jgi:hypothetical protein